jgi:hypothetical protein
MDRLGKALGRADRKKKGRKSNPSFEGVEIFQTKVCKFQQRRD